MAKTNEDLIKSYRKSNKDRKAAILAKAGYKTEAGYLKRLACPEPFDKDSKKAPTKKASAKISSKKESTKVSSEEAKPTDYVIAFDTTGSMSSYITSVRKHVEETVVKLFQNVPNLRVKIVAFGDYCDMHSKSTFGNAYQTIELTDDQNALVKFIQNAKNTGGGDGDEFYELVIKKINEETSWRDGVRSVLFIGDDRPHPVGYSYGSIVQRSTIDWKEEAMKARQMGIQYDTLRIHTSMLWYKELSDITGGACIDFRNASKVSNIVEASTYARSSKSMFASKVAAAKDSGDEELIGAYKSMEKLL